MSVVHDMAILNERGLHARAAAKFVKLAAEFDADITVGKRKIITYFVYPLVRAFDSSFKEP